MSRKLGAEFVGTFLLVFLAVGAAVFGIGGGVGVDESGPGSGVVGVAFAFGLVVLMLAYAFGPVSGTHVNPAVTLAMVLAKRMPGREGAGYAAAQFAGAIARRRHAQAVRVVLRRHRPDRCPGHQLATTTAPSTCPAPSSSRPC